MVAPNKATSTILKLVLCPKLSFSGFTEVLPSAFSLAKSGDSFIFRRMIIDTTTRIMESRKG